MNKKLLLVVGLFVALLGTNVSAAELGGRWNAGLNYPGFSLRYGLADNFSAGIKIQPGEDINIVGTRGYYYLTNTEKALSFFTGVETDVILFKGEESSGTGMAGIFFFGAEYFMTRTVSLAADLGPSLIILSDTDTSQAAVDSGMIADIALHYYFK